MDPITITTVGGWGTYPGANAAIARQHSDVLERFAPEIVRDLAAMATSSIALGGSVEICYLRTVRRCIVWLETGTVVRLDFQFFFIKVSKCADLPSLSILHFEVLSDGNGPFSH